jgi:hypothetical protein
MIGWIHYFDLKQDRSLYTHPLVVKKQTRNRKNGASARYSPKDSPLVHFFQLGHLSPKIVLPAGEQAFNT